MKLEFIETSVEENGIKFLVGQDDLSLGVCLLPNSATCDCGRQAPRLHARQTARRQRGQRAMSANEHPPAADYNNKRMSSPAPMPAPIAKQKAGFRTELGRLTIRVLDFDSLGRERCLQALKEAKAEDRRYVLWYPLQYRLSEALKYHRELVAAGATLFDKVSPDEPEDVCWARALQALEPHLKLRPDPYRQ